MFVFSLSVSEGEKVAKEDPKVIKVYRQDQKSTAVWVNQWQVEPQDKKEREEGILSLPGDVFIFEVPSAFKRSKTLDKIVLLHRKDKKDELAMKSVVDIRMKPGTKDKTMYAWDYSP